jgi:L-ascorbate metabolism protein UlaG (beta-lactamase superfamily)
MDIASTSATLFPTTTVTHPGVSLDSLPKIDLILISHDHYDHLDLKSIHALFERQRGEFAHTVFGIAQRFQAFNPAGAELVFVTPSNAFNPY